MKKSHHRILQAAVCLCLCFWMLFGVPLVCGATEENVQDTTDLMDYSLQTQDIKQELSASELFYKLYGVYPPSAEMEYLDQLSGITLQYTDLIPPSIVSTNYNGDAGVLEVTVPTYTYTASNGVLVEWVPTSVTLDGKQLPLVKNGDAYGCQFEDLFYSKNFDIYVSFVWNATLPAEAVDHLLTKPHIDGMEALKVVEEYEQTLLNPYWEALKRYEVYEAYQQALKDHAQYLIDVENYEKALPKYQAYLEDYAQYLVKKAEYDAYAQNKADWEQYYAYQEFLKNDLERYNEYLLYQGKINKVLGQLAVLESLFVSDSNTWTFYPSLMGGTVTSVTSRKEELIAAGCNAKDIYSADEATEILRERLTAYSELREQEYPSEHAKVAALYEYYTAYYVELKDAFAQLYGALISLYDNEFVVIYAKNEGKLERFQQFIGQLYVTATCLDDSEKGMRMENWRISGKKLSEVVEPVNLISDTGKSHPSEVSMPDTEVERVEAVEPIAKPTVTLSPVPEPTAPTEVKEPVKPAFVAEPDKDNPPPAAEHPGAVPARPDVAEALWNLAIALRDGSVPKREAEGVAQPFFVEKTVACPISIHNLKTVTFYDMDGSTVLYQQTVNYGEAVTYAGPSPQRSDPYYTYYFKGWVLSDGSAPSLDAVCENLSIFANYQKERRLYRIRWILDGVEFDTHCYYGDLPKPPMALEKPGTVDMEYRFTGWDKELTAVTENATYVGGFELVPRTYTVTWITGEGSLTTTVKHGELPVFPWESPSYLSGADYYRFTGWDKDLQTPITSNRTFYAKYAKEKLAEAGNGAALTVTNDGKSITVLAGASDVFIQNVARYAASQALPLTIRWERFSATYSGQALNTLIDSFCVKLDLEQRTVSGGIAYSVSYVDASGNGAGIHPMATVTLPKTSEDGLGYRYALSEKNTWKDLADQTHSLSGSFTLLVKKAGRVTVENNAYCNISGLPLYAFMGDWVSIDVGCEFGYEIVGAVLIKENGTKTEISGLKFQMPSGNVTVQLKVEKIVYHVTFLVDGKVYSQADYGLGEEILIPENPQKSQDGTYSYEFLEWSPAVTIAMGDHRALTYHAVFSKTLLNGVDPYRSGNNNNALLNTYLPIALGVVALGIFLFVFLRRRKTKGLASHAEDE